MGLCRWWAEHQWGKGRKAARLHAPSLVGQQKRGGIGGREEARKGQQELLRQQDDAAAGFCRLCWIYWLGLRVCE